MILAEVQQRLIPADPLDDVASNHIALALLFSPDLLGAARLRWWSIHTVMSRKASVHYVIPQYCYSW